MLVILLIHLTLNYIGCLKSQERFSGGLLGVSADVVLFTESNHASIKLSGIPLGGVSRASLDFTNSADLRLKSTNRSTRNCSDVL